MKRTKLITLLLATAPLAAGLAACTGAGFSTTVTAGPTSTVEPIVTFPSTIDPVTLWKTDNVAGLRAVQSDVGVLGISSQGDLSGVLDRCRYLATDAASVLEHTDRLGYTAYGDQVRHVFALYLSAAQDCINGITDGDTSKVQRASNLLAEAKQSLTTLDIKVRV